jgi:hypothetical protein
VLKAFTAEVLGAFTGAVLGTFTVIITLATIAFSFPVLVFMGTRGGGIGITPITGVIRITHMITQIIITQITRAHTTVIMHITAICPTEPEMPALPL